MNDYLQQLDSAVKENIIQHPALKEDQAFVYWFMTAFITEDFDAALDAVLGGSNDKNIDAIYIDDEIRTVYVVQGKYRKNVSKNESRSDVMTFSQVADLLHGPTKAFNVVLNNADTSMQSLLDRARKSVKNKGYQLALQYVTTGRVSENHENEAFEFVAEHEKTTFQLFDNHSIQRLMQDYIDGAAPPIPKVKLAVEGGEAFDSYDPKTKVTSWVFTMRGDKLGALFNDHGVRVFARNIRGFMGKKTTINQSLASTVEESPEMFWYYNNGATIICDSAKQVKEKGAQYLITSNAQIINGQQTTRTLADLPASKNVKVLLRVIVVPRSSDSDFAHYNQMVSEIVKATNSQNAIKPADLISNDAEQIRIEREFKKLDFYYARKSMTKAEMRAYHGARNRQIIKRDDLVMAIASCTIDPAVVRKGKQQFFVSPYYENLFNSRKIKEYLALYWLYSFSRYVYKGKGAEIGYSRHLVNYHIWCELKGVLTKKVNVDNFIYLVRRRQYQYLEPLEKMLEILIREAMKCYKSNKYYMAKDKTGKEKRFSYAEIDYFKRGKLLKDWQLHLKNDLNKNIHARYLKQKNLLSEELLEYE